MFWLNLPLKIWTIYLFIYLFFIYLFIFYLFILLLISLFFYLVIFMHSVNLETLTYAWQTVWVYTEGK